METDGSRLFGPVLIDVLRLIGNISEHWRDMAAIAYAGWAIPGTARGAIDPIAVLRLMKKHELLMQVHQANRPPGGAPRLNVRLIIAIEMIGRLPDRWTAGQSASAR